MHPLRTNHTRKVKSSTMTHISHGPGNGKGAAKVWYDDCRVIEVQIRVKPRAAGVYGWWWLNHFGYLCTGVADATEEEDVILSVHVVNETRIDRLQGVYVTSPNVEGVNGFQCSPGQDSVCARVNRGSWNWNFWCLNFATQGNAMCRICYIYRLSWERIWLQQETNQGELTWEELRCLIHGGTPLKFLTGNSNLQSEYRVVTTAKAEILGTMQLRYSLQVQQCQAAQKYLKHEVYISTSYRHFEWSMRCASCMYLEDVWISRTWTPRGEEGNRRSRQSTDGRSACRDLYRGIASKYKYQHVRVQKFKVFDSVYSSKRSFVLH